MKKIIFAIILSSFFFLGNAQSLQEGIKHLENENYTAALNTFNAICKADPKNSGVYYYIGEVHYQLEDYAEAEKAYRKGLVTNPNCAECNVGLGKLQLDKGNTVEADKLFALAIRVNKKNPVIYGLIGDAYLYSKRPNVAKAIEHLGHARDLDPKRAVYWAHLGDAFAMNNSHGEAMTAYETAVEKDPSNAEAYIAMARIWARAQQEDLAIPKLEEAMRLSPDDARPIKDLYELYIGERRYAKVVPLLEKYISLIGTDVDAKVRLVKFLTFQAKDYDRAIPEGEKLLAQYPDQYTLHRWLAWSYVGKAKQMEADQANDTTITDSLIRMQYEKAFANSELLFKAIEKDKDKRKAFPEDYEFWALAALKLGKVDDAAHIYRKYLEFDPSKAPDIYASLAKSYYDSANYDQAIVYYKRKMETKPLTNTEEWWLGQSYFKSKLYSEADSSVARVLAITPNYPAGWIMRAKIAREIDPEDAKFLAHPFYQKAIEHGEADPVKHKRSLIEAYLYMAYYAVQHDQNAAAIEFYGKILALDPNNAVAQDNLEKLKNN